VEKPEGKRPLGRLRHRWMDNITMGHGEMGGGDVDWIGLAQDRNRWRALVNLVLKSCRPLVNSVFNFRVPQNVGELPSGLTKASLSKSAQLHRVSLVSLASYPFFKQRK
jgi:hypothetical protein